MAEAALFSIATDILKSLATEIAKTGGSKILLLCSAKEELRSLKGTVKSIQAVLLDAEKQQGQNRQVKDWLGRLKGVLYDAQDLLDDVATENLRRKVTPGNKKLKAVRVFFSKSNQLAHRLDVANKIQDLRKTLVEIENDSKLLHLERHLREETAAIGRGKKPECLPSPDEKVIGREEDKKMIKQLLIDSSSGQSVSFVAIVGKGGLGKTALARLVYNDGEVREHFELKMWVCVSDVFDVNSIIKDILKSAKCQDLENKTLDELLNLLRETLSRKKYLLVLDDLWNEDRDKWCELGQWLQGGKWGSKILVTTRSRKVGEVTHARSDIHDLRGLSEDESWSLFKKNAFENGEESLDSEQEKIGRDLVKKCAGVPLAVRTIGSVFYSKKKDEWRHYEGLELLQIPQVDEKDDGIMKVLQFSYDHLRSSLKHCFAYCSLFPKDFVYNKDMIIYLWVAQGFIELDIGKDNLEEVANTYLTELLRGSFLDVERIDINGEVETFKMHDLMHDLAQKVAGGECKIINFEGGDYDGGIRHASFFSKILSEEKVMSFLETSKLRTFLYSKSVHSMYFGWGSEPSVLDFHKVVSELRYCRALLLVSIEIPLPPFSFGKLKHLRFLTISENQSIQSLPDSITDLVNLQHLELRDCKKLEIFPRDFRKLIKLRYFLIRGCDLVSHLPPLSELPSLRTLILWHLHALEFVQQTSDVGPSNTTRPFFPSLESLSLSDRRHAERWWEKRQAMREYQKHHRSDNSQPSFPKLKRLDLDCQDVESSMLQTLLRSANNLEIMRLNYCNVRSFFRGMRHLSSLRELHVHSCEGLDLSYEEEGQHDTQWPFLTNLRVLKISSCRDLMELPEGIQHVTTLQSLEIYECHMWILPSWIENLSLLEKLVLFDCEGLKYLSFHIRDLRRLKELRIIGCPRLEKNHHEDWLQIPVVVWENDLDRSAIRRLRLRY